MTSQELEIALDKACALAPPFEGCVLHPYLDVGDVPTIGFGATHLLNGTKVTMETPDITMAEAKKLLRREMREYLDDVVEMVTVKINPNQLAALTDFAYNEGPHRLAGSMLLHLLNQGDINGAADQFRLWIYGAGRILSVLIRRRSAEKKLFLTPYVPVAA